MRRGLSCVRALAAGRRDKVSWRCKSAGFCTASPTPAMRGAAMLYVLHQIVLSALLVAVVAIGFL